MTLLTCWSKHLPLRVQVYHNRLCRLKNKRRVLISKKFPFLKKKYKIYSANELNDVITFQNGIKKVAFRDKSCIQTNRSAEENLPISPPSITETMTTLRSPRHNRTYQGSKSESDNSWELTLKEWQSCLSLLKKLLTSKGSLSICSARISHDTT